MMSKLIYVVTVAFVLVGWAIDGYAQVSPTPSVSPTPVVAPKPVVTSTPAVTPVPVNKTRFPIWKTITIGNFKTKLELVAALQKAGVTSLSSSIIDNGLFTVAVAPAQINLVKVQVKDFKLDRYGASRKAMYAKAKEWGLELCPLEVGPQLRLQYSGQPTGEVLRIAMTPVLENGYEDVFTVEQWQGFKPWLYARGSKPGMDFTFDEDVWIFMIPTPANPIAQ